MDRVDNERHLNDDVVRLDAELSDARNRVKACAANGSRDEAGKHQEAIKQDIVNTRKIRPLSFGSHALLLLSDSALPLGSFAFSSGLESYLAHRPARPIPSIHPFLSLSLSSVASTVLPYLLAAYSDPTALVLLDDTLDACTLCPVARRASTAQGHALLTLWERAFKATVGKSVPAALALAQIAQGLRDPSSPDRVASKGHLGPVWAVMTVAMDISIEDSAYAFLFNHAKAVMSAAVRASVVGPYQAQGVLASDWLRKEIATRMEDNWEVQIEDAGQATPMMDIWIGRHEMLYSRIFNS